MKIKPLGYNVLIEMEEIKQEVEEGALKGFVLHGDDQQNREQEGHFVGIVRAFGPTAYKGFANCEGPKEWGVDLGDKVEFHRYDGKKLDHPGYENYRLIEDSKIVAVLEEAK